MITVKTMSADTKLSGLLFFFLTVFSKGNLLKGQAFKSNIEKKYALVIRHNSTFQVAYMCNKVLQTNLCHSESTGDLFAL